MASRSSILNGRAEAEKQNPQNVRQYMSIVLFNFKGTGIGILG
jgi:hypothetical protein